MTNTHPVITVTMHPWNAKDANTTVSQKWRVKSSGFATAKMIKSRLAEVNVALEQSHYSPEKSTGIEGLDNFLVDFCNFTDVPFKKLEINLG